MNSESDNPTKRQRLHELIFEADTLAGKVFDIALLVSIILSVIAVLLESVQHIEARFGATLRTIEWTFTILFTIEYIARLISVKKPLKYALSFLGVIDFLSIIPTYLSLLVVGSQALLILRTIRLLRVFRILKLARYIKEGRIIGLALKASRFKITVFLVGVLSVVLIMGTVMYLVEGSENGFTSIPRSIYWAVVTLTTVGYGDIAPQTVLGQALATIIMIMGYAIIAVPTGIVSVEFSNLQKGNSPAPEKEPVSTQACPECSREGHDIDADYCKFCGAKL